MRKIFNIFKTKDTEYERVDSNLEYLKREIDKCNEVKEKIGKLFLFEVPEYILLDIVEEEDYQHFCLMVNLAKVNNRITEKQADELKTRIKEILNIRSCYDKLKLCNYEGV